MEVDSPSHVGLRYWLALISPCHFTVLKQAEELQDEELCSFLPCLSDEQLGEH